MKSLFTKLLVITLFTLTMSACSTVQSHFRPNSVTVVTPPEIQYPTIALQEVAIETPDLTIRERTIPLNPALHEKARIALTPAEVKCLADVIYHESRSEREIGQVGVGYVVLNRMGHPQYPKTACGVAYDRKHGCQFSWACGKAAAKIRYPALYEASRKVAMDVMTGRVENPVGDSIQFRQARLKAPRAMFRTVTIDGHSFYAASL